MSWNNQVFLKFKTNLGFSDQTHYLWYIGAHSEVHDGGQICFTKSKNVEMVSLMNCWEFFSNRDIFRSLQLHYVKTQCSLLFQPIREKDALGNLRYIRTTTLAEPCFHLFHAKCAVKVAFCYRKSIYLAKSYMDKCDFCCILLQQLFTWSSQWNSSFYRATVIVLITNMTLKSILKLWKELQATETPTVDIII